MKRSVLLAIVCAVLFLGCPKRGPVAVSGTDEEKLDQYAAQLEEIRTRAQAGKPSCDEWCSMSKQVCDISQQVCAIAASQSDRPEIQQRCSASQEECAQFNDSCRSCR